MRVYTRGVEQGLLIGNGIQVNVLEVLSDRVRLAITDPDSTPTYREEVLFLPTDDGDGEEPEAEYVPVYELLGSQSLIGSLR
jgi:carbon storage regulator CsrA